MSDLTRWGVAILVLAGVIAVLDTISTSTVKVTVLIVCLMIIGSVMVIGGALQARRDGTVQGPDD